MAAALGHVLDIIQEAKDKQVKLLDLSQRLRDIDDKASILSEVFKLSQLEELNLSRNELTVIPRSISHLRELRNLDLSNNRLATLPATLSELQDLKTLNLDGNLLESLPDSLSKLRRLVSLEVGANQLDFLPDWIYQLEELESINLAVNNLGSLPKSFSTLQNLKNINIAYNRFDNIPEYISQFRNLKALSIGGFGRGQRLNLPQWIQQLESLEALDITDFGLISLPEWLSRLTELKYLNLNTNGLKYIPEWLGSMQTLETLSLEENLLIDFPAPICELKALEILTLNFKSGVIPQSIKNLTNLNFLSLSMSNISVLPDFISSLHNLGFLTIDGNNLTTLPDTLPQLDRLHHLSMQNNLLKGIPDIIYQLRSLESLDFRNVGWHKVHNKNEIREISPRILKLEKLNTLVLTGNPIESPPLEVVEKGARAIMDYFRQLQAQGQDYLYEAKLLIVGEGGAGKTTLAKKILDPNYRLLDEKSTQGIEVKPWYFERENGGQFRVNIWDFGGQEIYHATHQFFLTKRSLYALVADTRKEDTDFYYWLNIVELLSDNSPLLIINNEKQDRVREINERQLRGQFTNLKETLATNLSTNRGLPDVIKEVKHHINNLPHIGTPLPRTWVTVREQLERDPRNHISLNEYLDVCQQNGFTDHKDKLQLSGYLHDLGVCLHFQEDPLLKKTVVLKPKWGTDAVYKVLDNKTVNNNLGRFNRDDLEKIWHEPEYSTMQDELLQLMINFKLCYKIRGVDSYIAPQLLTENQPQYDWDEADNLILRYTYEFMPKGIITQLIVAMHPYIDEQRYVWKSGVILSKDQTRAEVLEYYGKREVRIRVAGNYKKDLLTIITYELERIHSSYKRLKYSRLIPCNCPACKSSQEPHYFSAEVLRQFIGDKQELIQCQKSYKMVSVQRLIEDVLEVKALTSYSDKFPVLMEAMKNQSELIIHGDVGTVVIQKTDAGDNIMPSKTKEKVVAKSAWANGSFYLFTFAVVIAGLGVLSRTVSLLALPIILIAGILFIPIIGAFQLKMDERLSEKPFIELMKMVIGQLPLIGKLARHSQLDR